LLHQPGAFHLEQWIEKPAAVKRRVWADGAFCFARPLNSRGPNVPIDDEDEGQESAKSGLALMIQPNDRTGVSLPDAETDYQSRLGPIAPVSRG
jgi:hypothetical protein